MPQNTRWEQVRVVVTAEAWIEMQCRVDQCIELKNRIQTQEQELLALRRRVETLETAQKNTEVRIDRVDNDLKESVGDLVVQIEDDNDQHTQGIRMLQDKPTVTMDQFDAVKHDVQRLRELVEASTAVEYPGGEKLVPDLLRVLDPERVEEGAEYEARRKRCKVMGEPSFRTVPKD